MEFLNYQNIGLIISAYLVGAIPTALWSGKLFHKKDIRKHGSKNAGATNTIRVLGLKTGIPVLLFDILKGYAATQLAFLMTVDTNTIQLQLLLGLFAVGGHLFPVFANFKGGKGIATLLGMFLSIHYLSALMALAIFIIIFAISRIVSLGSILAVLAYPAISWYLFNLKNPFFLGVTLFFVFIVVYTHRENIIRLLKGEEKKLSLSKKN